MEDLHLATLTFKNFLSYLKQIHCNTWLVFNLSSVKDGEKYPAAFFKNVDVNQIDPFGNGCDVFVHVVVCYNWYDHNMWAWIADIASTTRVALVLLEKAHIPQPCELPPAESGSGAAEGNVDIHKANRDKLLDKAREITAAATTEITARITKHSKIVTEWEKIAPNTKTDPEIASKIQSLQAELISNLIRRRQVADTETQLMNVLSASTASIDDFSSRYLTSFAISTAEQAALDTLWDTKASESEPSLGDVMPMLAPVVTRVPLTTSALLAEEGVARQGGRRGVTTAGNENKRVVVSESPYDPTADELALTRLTDPLAEFIKFSCGSIQIKMTMAFTRVPPLDQNNYDGADMMAEFRSCLTPTMSYAYESTDSWIRGISKGYYSIPKIHPILHKNLFVCAATLCGQIIRKSMTHNPSRGVMPTRHSMKEDNRNMNIITRELIVLLDRLLLQNYGIKADSHFTPTNLL